MELTTTVAATGAPTAPVVTTPAPLAATEAAAVTPPTTAAPENAPDKYSEANRIAKEKARLHRERQVFKQKQVEMAQKEAQFKAWEEAKAQAKLNPEKYLEQGGLSYEDLVQYKINGGRVTPEMEIKALREDMTRAQQMQEEHRAQQEKLALEREQGEVNETIETFKSDIHDFIHSNPDDYELTALYNVEHLVYDTIQTHWENSLAAYNQAMQDGRSDMSKPRIMSKKEAADLVEQYMDTLVDQATKTKRYQKKYAPQPATDPNQATVAAQKQPISEAGFQIKTLNNSVQGSANPSTASTRSKVEDDAFKRALSRLG